MNARPNEELDTLWLLRNYDMHSINRASCVLNTHFGSDLACVDLSLRLKMLSNRYNTFKEVVATSGVHWAVQDKVIMTTESTWKLLFERNPLAGAYYYRDEPEFSLLATMFGLGDVKVEDGNEVITLSDTTTVIVITDPTEHDEPTK
ncbi:hypothetical protein AAHA92_33109 [Salvia divinorum]|uniref:Myb/SANT-like domain-containing protein n=1 Tax=Salvia divinorum TaxID=28513 RepID=A0ABD1FMW1_SALDI